MTENSINISKEEIHETLNDWQSDFFKEIENKIKKEIPSNVYKKSLLHCLGFVDYSANVSTVLEELNILDDIKALDTQNKLNIED